MAGFGVMSLVCAIAPNVEILIAARALQGVAGALLVPSTLALLIATFPPDERGAAIGSWTAWTGIATVIGPLAGGVLIDQASWRWIFAINLIPVAITLFLVARHVPRAEQHPEGGRVDFLGAALCALSLGGAIFALIEQPRLGWTDPAVLITGIGGLVCGALFVMHESRTPQPMLPLSLFRSRNFAVGNLTTLAMYAGLSGMMFLLGLFIQQVAGYSALEAGAAFLPLTLITFALAKRFGALADRYGPRFFMSVGPVVAGVGMLLLLRIDADADYLTQLLPGIAVFGLGLALTVAPLTASVLSSVDDSHSGIASGVNNAVARVAGLLAIAALGTVVASQFTSTVDERVGSTAPPAALAAATDRPLSVSEATPELRAATRDASVDGFRLGVGIAALLTISGGLIAAVGIQNPRRVVAAEECAGGPICGAPTAVEPLPETAAAATA